MASYGLRHLQEEENPTKRVTRANAKLLDVADVPAKQPVRRGLAERKNAAAPESRKPTFEVLKPKQVEPEKPHRRSRGKETFEGKENANELQGIVGQHDEDGLDRVIGCADYINDIYAYLLSVEDDFAVDEGFLVDKEVTPKMRSILVDWLMQVHLRFHLLPETLHLTIYLVDRFLTEAKVSKAELQLVGVTCMFIASKYEEMYAPEIVDFEFITDNTYSKKDIIRMEIRVLGTIGFKLSRSHSLHFARWLTQNLNVKEAVHSQAKYFGEIGLLDYSLAHIRPSVMACVSLWLACRIHGLPHSRASIAAYFSVVTSPSLWEDEIRLFARAVVKLHTQSKLMALRSKFAASKWHNASNLKPECIELLTKIYTSTGALD